MTRIGSIFALVLVALLASFALVDAGLPPALAGGGGIVEATPLEAPVVLPSESSIGAAIARKGSSGSRSTLGDDPLDDEEKAPTDASGAVGAYTLRDESTPTHLEPKATSAHRPADGLPDDDDDGADPETAATRDASTRPNDPAGPADADADYDADDDKRQPRATIDAADERETRDAADVTRETRSSSSSSSSSSNFSSTDPSSRSPSTDAADGRRRRRRVHRRDVEADDARTRADDRERRGGCAPVPSPADGGAGTTRRRTRPRRTTRAKATPSRPATPR